MSREYKVGNMSLIVRKDPAKGYIVALTPTLYQSLYNPFVFDDYNTIDEAVRDAELLQQRLQLAIDNGYSCSGENLKHPDGKNIPLPKLLDYFTGEEYGDGKKDSYEDLIRTGLMEGKQDV